MRKVVERGLIPAKQGQIEGGIYAAEEQPQTRSHKFDEKTNRQIDQVIALVNGK